MKEIQLTGGMVALVDDADYDWLNQWKWHAMRRACCGDYCAVRNTYSEGKKLIYMHRLILGITDRNILSDHINRNPLDNQRHNLRAVNNAQNMMNRGASNGSSSKYKGVRYHKLSKKWQAQIGVNRTTKSLGYYISEVDAAAAYNKAAKELHGDFAVINEIQNT
jgi:hypothetical protein